MKTIHGILLRTTVVLSIAFATGLIVFALFCWLSPSFFPGKFLRDFGFWKASDDIARSASIPIVFVSPSLMILVLMPVFSLRAKNLMIAYVVLAAAGILAFIAFLSSAAVGLEEDAWVELKSFYVFNPVCAFTIAVACFALFKIWRPKSQAANKS